MSAIAIRLAVRIIFHIVKAYCIANVLTHSMTKLGRRKFLMVSSAVAGSGFLKACAPDLSAPDASASSPGTTPASGPPQSEIKVGLLHSLSGTMALSETSIVDAEMLAIAEINAKGGVLGQQLVPIPEDGASDWPTFAEKAEKLIDQDGVAVIFGGLTSASRKAMSPVVKAKNHLLWYPGAYEGEECAEQIFYAGATANQQIEPAVDWMLGNRGKTFFLVSSNARTTHEIVKAQLKAKGGKVAGEAYVPVDSSINVDMTPLMSDIKQALPKGGVIFNSLIGDYNRVFFKALQGAGLSADQYLVMSVGIGEEEVFQIGSGLMRGHYAASNYFQTIKSPENEKWIAEFQRKYGSDRVLGDAMESAYVMVHLWAQAVAAARSIDPLAVSAATYDQTFKAPSGSVTVRSNHHLLKSARIGRVGEDGQFEILVPQPKPIEPNPWSQYLDANKGFACDWSDPAKGSKYPMAGAS
jgi:urea transport system substrate-binding protein